jgi:hypothetical protein
MDCKCPTPECRLEQKLKLMNTQQLEIKLALASAPGRRLRRRQRAVRARWWFERMHRAVDAAAECRPVPPRPPKQIALPVVPNRNAA